jgi:tRNA-modifying protein YgfZ
MLFSMSSLDVLTHDYRAVTERCGLLDRSERGKLALSGADAKRFLQGQVSNDVEALEPGRGCYAAFLTPKGKMLGDLRILDAGDELLLDTERVALQELFNMIRRFSVGYDVTLHKRTVECGLLSLIGPEADQLLPTSAPTDTEHAHVAGHIGGTDVRVIRTDVGVDLLAGAGETAALASALEDAGAVPVSVDAVDCVRIERGRPRYGTELDDTVIPQEAGLNDRAVSFTKGCYVGQETVARLYYRGKPNRHLRGLRCAAPVASGAPLMLGEREVGHVGSATVSPRHGPIALALVRREAAVGDSVSVGPDAIEAQVLELPFV